MNTCLYCIDVYTVNEGDTLYSIAEKYDLPVSLLMKVNEIDNPYNLQALHSRNRRSTAVRAGTLREKTYCQSRRYSLLNC